MAVISERIMHAFNIHSSQLAYMCGAGLLFLSASIAAKAAGADQSVYFAILALVFGLIIPTLGLLFRECSCGNVTKAPTNHSFKFFSQALLVLSVLVTPLFGFFLTHSFVLVAPVAGVGLSMIAIGLSQSKNIQIK